MFTALLGAVEIADIIVFVVLGLGLVMGLIGGLAKAFKGIFATLSIILISLLLVGVTVSPISASSIGRSLSGAFEGATSGWGTAFTSTVYIAESDGKPLKDGNDFVYCVEVDGEMVKLDSVGGEGLLGSLKGKMAVGLAKNFVNEENSGKVSLASFAANELTKIIFDIALFIIYCIVLALLFKLLGKASKKMQTGSTSVRVLDKVLGAVVAAGLALLTLLLVFAIIKLAAPAGSKVAQFFENANIAGVLYNKNPMAKMLTKLR